MSRVVGWVAVGLMIGFAVWVIGPSRPVLGMVPTVALGVIGAVGCGQLASVVWTERVSSPLGAGLVLPAVGATLLLWGYLAAADSDGQQLPTGV